jgi:hypothetical protein
MQPFERAWVPLILALILMNKPLIYTKSLSYLQKMKTAFNSETCLLGINF